MQTPFRIDSNVVEIYLKVAERLIVRPQEDGYEFDSANKLDVGGGMTRQAL
ncbi:MAG: hypothetical protein ACNA8H_02175 [Anaerolineales bacterium]